MTGDVTREDGTTQVLVGETLQIVAFARTLQGSTGDVALLGHSMASDLVVRAAKKDGDIRATIAVSLFSREVTPEAPRNLLMIVGGWENFLSAEALRLLRESHGAEAQPEQTYGSINDGSARRLVLSDSVEHVGVLYSRESLAEARDWLNLIFGRSGAGALDIRGPWIGLLLAGVLALGWPLCRALPRVGVPDRPLSAARIGAAAVMPAVVTPLVLWPLPTGFLPVLVADYLAVHFAVYGAISLALLMRFGAVRPGMPGLGPMALGAVTGAVLIAGLGVAIDSYVASYVPIASRLPMLAVLSIGAVALTLGDAWLIHAGAGRWWPGLLSKLCLFASLAGAIALDLESLFFLIIIAPVLVLFFLVHGLWARWIRRATGNPGVAGLAIGLALGWALTVTFPMLA